MLIFSSIFLFISNAVTLRRDKSILFFRITIKTLLFSSFIALNNLYIKPLEKGIGIYGGLFHVNTFTQSFNMFVFVVGAIILILTAFYPGKLYNTLSSRFTYNKEVISNKIGEQFRIIEYALIIMFILCGGVFLINTADLVSIFLSIELQTYGLYILSTLYRDSESATASGLTYFLLGGLSSCFILLGSGLIYANSGTTNLDNIYILYSRGEFRDLFQPFYIDLGLTIVLVGFLFKVGAALLHFWSLDAYEETCNDLYWIFIRRLPIVVIIKHSEKIRVLCPLFTVFLYSLPGFVWILDIGLSHFLGLNLPHNSQGSMPPIPPNSSELYCLAHYSTSDSINMSPSVGSDNEPDDLPWQDQFQQSNRKIPHYGDPQHCDRHTEYYRDQNTQTTNNTTGQPSTHTSYEVKDKITRTYNNGSRSVWEDVRMQHRARVIWCRASEHFTSDNKAVFERSTWEESEGGATSVKTSTTWTDVNGQKAKCSAEWYHSGSHQKLFHYHIDRTGETTFHEDITKDQ